MFVYADQAYTYSCADKDVQPAWDCDLWSGLGTKFAYIHTGMFETAFNGTTLTMSKRGSGLSKIVNPCIDKFITTKSYYDICVKHDIVDDCYANEFFPEGSASTAPWALPTSEQTGDCSSGYCGCCAGKDAMEAAGPYMYKPYVYSTHKPYTALCGFIKRGVLAHRSQEAQSVA